MSSFDDRWHEPLSAPTPSAPASTLRATDGGGALLAVRSAPTEQFVGSGESRTSMYAVSERTSLLDRLGDDALDDDDVLRSRPRRFRRRPVIVTYLVCALNVVLTVVELVENHKNTGRFFAPFDQNPLIGPDPPTLIQLGAKDVPRILEGNQYWRLITASALHAGLIHVALNSLAQLTVGRKLESRLGWWRVLLIYCVAGAGGNLCSALLLPTTLTVGASGAIFGGMGALVAEVLFMGRLASPSPCRDTTTILICVIFSLIMGLLPFVDNFAHIGGFVFGGLTSIFCFATTPAASIIQPRRSLVCATLCLGSVVALFVGLVVVFIDNANLTHDCGWCQSINCVDPTEMGWCNVD